MIRNSKKFLLLILCLFTISTFISACGGGGKSTPPSYPFFPVPTPSPTVSPTPEKYPLELSQTEFTVNVGETDNITVTLNGEDITETATYTVDQEAIASVEGGLITGLSAGFATVTVQAENAIEDKTFTVNVVDPNLPTLEVLPTELNLGIEEEASVTVTLNGEDVTDQVNYTSDKELIATAEKGVVKAGMQAGIENSPLVATITVSLEGANSATFKVNVTDDSDNEVQLDEDGSVLQQLGYEKVKNGDNYDIKRIADGEIVTNLEIPAIYSYNGNKYKITALGTKAFSTCSSLKNVIIPDSITTIGIAAFNSCTSLEEIIFPDSVTSLGSAVCSGCNSITTLKIGNGIKELFPGQFNSTSLKTITIGNSVTTIGIAVFSGASLLESVNFVENSSLTSISNAAFYNCTNPNLTISIPNSVTTISTYAFYNVNNINISEEQKTLTNYPWGAKKVNGVPVEQ